MTSSEKSNWYEEIWEKEFIWQVLRKSNLYDKFLRKVNLYDKFWEKDLYDKFWEKDLYDKIRET